MAYTEEFLKIKTDGFYNRVGKRIVDLLIALPLFVVMLPLYLIIVIVIIIESGWPVFYRGVRGGYKNKSFRIFKFRTMVRNAEKIGGATTALHDPRITRVGRFLRKTKLDEIPQLMNIITGEMSFVGPRPEVLKYVQMFKGLERYILEVRPGITDYSSLEFSDMDAVVGDGDVDTFFVDHILSKKNELRVKYVAEISLATDIRIFIQTVLLVAGHFFKKRDIQ